MTRSVAHYSSPSSACTVFAPGSLCSSCCLCLPSLVRPSSNKRRTNVSPIHLLICAITAYTLTRPCLYCTILVSVLLITLYDWQVDWFLPRIDIFAPDNRYLDTKTLAEGDGNGTIEALESLSAVTAKVGSETIQGLRHRLGSGPTRMLSGADWLKQFMGRREWRIRCLDIAIRY